jgi:alanine transaminase
MNVIDDSVADAKRQGIDPRAIVVINPGNPTGACMSVEEIANVFHIAHREGLIVFADEVYQSNIFQDKRPFVSMRKVLLDMAHSDDPSLREIGRSVPLVSLHSISKGFTGECGRRGGYFELTNFTQEIEDQVNKLASVLLCPPVQGQIGVDLLVRPPREGDPSYDLFRRESESNGEGEPDWSFDSNLAACVGTKPRTAYSTLRTWGLILSRLSGPARVVIVRHEAAKRHIPMVVKVAFGLWH